MSSDYLLRVADHLWQSTLFGIVICLIALSLRQNRAAVRHRLWLAASVKFLVPFSLLAAIGSQFRWESRPRVLSMMVDIGQPFSAGPTLVSSTAASATNISGLFLALIGVWICGTAVSLTLWFIRWRRVCRAVRLAVPSNLQGSIRVMLGPERLEPGVFGIFKPVLLLPKGIDQFLSPAQLQAVVAHELCHVRRRDNLAMAIHMVVETLFWFHPFIWFIKLRLIDEQERACDEEVLLRGGDPQVYAESILKICEFYLTSPLLCVSGISGSNLKKRIGDIMKNQGALKLSFSRALLIAAAATASVAAPILAGLTAAEAPPPTSLVAAPQAEGQRGNPWASRVMQEYRVGEITISGAKSLPDSVVRPLLGVVSGERYDESRLKDGFIALHKLYGSLGYIDFIPEPVMDFDDQKKVVNLMIRMDEGRQFTVNRISFTGNTTTPDEVIRREISLKEGQVLDASLLDVWITRLNQLGLFEEIHAWDIAVVPLSGDQPRADIQLRVKERGR
jgi:beta-lactamase regulating signal transducer with metallopeptidase domain